MSAFPQPPLNGFYWVLAGDVPTLEVAEWRDGEWWQCGSEVERSERNGGLLDCRSGWLRPPGAADLSMDDLAAQLVFMARLHGYQLDYKLTLVTPSKEQKRGKKR